MSKDDVNAVLRGDSAFDLGDWKTARMYYRLPNSPDAQVNYKYAVASWKDLPRVFEEHLASTPVFGKYMLPAFVNRVFPNQPLNKVMGDQAVTYCKQMKGTSRPFGEDDWSMCVLSFSRINQLLRAEVSVAIVAFARKAAVADPLLRDKVDALLAEVDSVFPGISNESTGHCFVATAVYGSPMAQEVQILRDFRDEVLMRAVWGRAFIKIYERLGPYIAATVRNHEYTKLFIRIFLLGPLMQLIRRGHCRRSAPVDDD